MCSTEKTRDALSKAHLLHAPGLGLPLSTRTSSSISAKIQSSHSQHGWDALHRATWGVAWHRLAEDKGLDLGHGARVAKWVSSANSGSKIRIHEALLPPHFSLIYFHFFIHEIFSTRNSISSIHPFFISLYLLKLIYF